MKINKRLFPLIVIIVSSLFLVIFYGDFFYKPNAHLFNVSGDAIKNYYTYVAHSKHDNYIEFEQMNYPYGENFLYLDCHPLLTIIIKTIANVFPAINNYTVGIINFLMLFSIVLTALFVYLILVKFKVDKTYALIGSIAISILSPQILRTTGHYALSYGFAIPFSWYLFLKFKEANNKWKWSFIMMTNIIAWYFIHAYLGMIIASFILLSFLFSFIYERKNFFSGVVWLHLFIQTIAPMLIFLLVIKVTDIHTGRNEQPSGILTYIANFQSIFLPSFAPLRNFYGGFIKIETNWEGWAYVGIASILFIVTYLINSVFKIFGVHLIQDTSFNNNKSLLTSLFASIILLLLSMGYPFKKMEYLLDWFPLINNFRSIARFSWPFFFVITISTTVYSSLLLKENKFRLLVLLAITVIPLTYVWEGLPLHKSIRKQMRQEVPNYFNAKYLPQSFKEGLHFADKSKFQAIVPLPFFHTGSDAFKAYGTNKSYLTTMVISYHSGIPIMGNYATNTSISESKNIIQVISPNYYNKKIINDITNRKPFLIVYSNESLDKYQAELLNNCEKLFSCGNFSLFSISYDKLLLNNSSNWISQFESKKDQFSSKDGFLISSKDTSTLLFYDSFENEANDTAYRGRHALRGELKNYTHVAHIDPAKLIPGKEYTASFWMYNEEMGQEQAAQSSIAFIETRDKADNINWITTFNPARSAVIDESWSLIELSFKMPENIKQLSILVKGDNKSDKIIYIDDVLVKESEVNVYKVIRETDGIIRELFINNHKVCI